MAVEIGQHAPEFMLINNERKRFKLDDLGGKPAVLVFFPGAFTGGCQQEACTFRDSMNEYNELGISVYGISVDSFFVQNAFITDNNLNFEFLSDYSRETIENYGIAVNDFAGMPGYTTSMRAVFLIDSSGIITYKEAVPPPDQPNFDALKEAVTKL
mgnify:CR=1 FL=1